MTIVRNNYAGVGALVAAAMLATMWPGTVVASPLALDSDLSDFALAICLKQFGPQYLRDQADLVEQAVVSSGKGDAATWQSFAVAIQRATVSKQQAALIGDKEISKGDAPLAYCLSVLRSKAVINAVKAARHKLRPAYAR